MSNGGVMQTLPPITLGALTTAAAMYPVDLVRALKMSSAQSGGDASVATLLRDFHRAHGMKGFVSQGVGPEMLRATYMRVSKFFLFPIAHRAMFGLEPSEGSTTSKAIAAAVCSLPEGLTIAPIETAKIGLQLDSTNVYKNSMSNFTRATLQNRGWTGMFTGYFGIAYRQTSWTAVYFATLDDFKKASSSIIPDSWESTQRLAGGMSAGMFGAVFNTPGDVIRSTIQKRVLAGEPKKVPFTLAMPVRAVGEFFAEGGRIVASKGVTGLWTGFGFKAMHLGGSGALLALLIPAFKGMMGVTKE
eukprot:m.18807 g.18807  ORF g.18807 m.18807 type:complete len:302 (+) comp3628_c0_seq1:54-959(+)